MSEARAHGLLPCPFCGGEAELFDGGSYATIRCQSCVAQIDRCLSSDDAAAVTTAWNTRAALDTHKPQGETE